MSSRAGLAVSLAMVAFVVNPNFGCVDDDFEYGAAEMRAMVEGTWDFSAPGETTPRLTVVLSYGGMASAASSFSPIRAAAACGNREFVGSANACIPSTSMSLTARVLHKEAPFAAALESATLTVLGTKLGLNSLTVSFADGSSMDIGVSPTPGGTRQGALISAQRTSSPVIAVRRP